MLGEKYIIYNNKEEGGDQLHGDDVMQMVWWRRRRSGPSAIKLREIWRGISNLDGGVDSWMGLEAKMEMGFGFPSQQVCLQHALIKEIRLAIRTQWEELELSQERKTSDSRRLKERDRRKRELEHAIGRTRTGKLGFQWFKHWKKMTSMTVVWNWDVGG